MKKRAVNKTVCHFVGSILGVEISSEELIVKEELTE